MNTDDTAVDCTDANAFVDTYEELRSDMLSDSPSGSHFGLILLMRQGIAAWMDRRAACSAPAKTVAVARRSEAAPLISDELHAGMARVLACMAMADRKEINA